MKKIKSKLSVNTETLRELSRHELVSVVGGGSRNLTCQCLTQTPDCQGYTAATCTGTIH